MNYAALRELFERVHGLDGSQRRAFYESGNVAADLVREVEEMLGTTVDDPIPAVIGRIAEAQLDAALPQRIGPWRVLGVLGEGGMGVVLRGARDDGEYEREVAIKLIHGHASAALRERFRRELQVLAALDHPDIAGLIDAGSAANGEPYLAMPLIDGETLPQWLARATPSLSTRLRLFLRLCRAVQHAHQRLVVHRDLKPSNVMVRRDGAPVLLDFGIAKLLDRSDDATVTRALTPAYASPEQLDGRVVTTATDVYGLGLILYEMLAGRLPPRTNGETGGRELPPPSQFAAQAANPVTRGEARRLRGDLDRIVGRATRTDPGQRYPAAQALAEDIDAWLNGRPVHAAGVQSHWYVLGCFVLRHRVAVAASVAALALCAALALQWKQERDSARLAQGLAQREAETANGVTGFLIGLFSELDPDLHPGRELSGRALLDIGRERLDALDTTRPELRARLQLGLGEVYANIGVPEPAQNLLRAALATLDAGVGADAPDAARAANALSHAYSLSQRSRDALAAAQRAVELSDDGAPTSREMLAHALLARGTAQQHLGRADLAESDYARAETLYTQLNLPGDLASVRHNRASLAEARGDLQGALALYRQARADKTRVLGADHPGTLGSQHGEGKVLALLGRFDEAARVFGDLLERTARVHGAHTEPMAKVLGEQAGIFQDAGDFVRAQAAYERELALKRELSPAGDSMPVAITLNNYATLLEDRGDARAEALYRESQVLRERLLPPGDIGRSTVPHNLARLHLAQGRLVEAREDVERAYAIRGQLASTHPLRLATLGLYARIAAAQGDAGTARKLAREFDAGITAIDPPFNLQRERELLHAALAHLDGKRDERAAALTRARIGLAKVLPAAHPRLAGLRVLEAEALLDAGDVAQARATAAQAAPILRAALVSGAPLLRQLDALEQRLIEARARGADEAE